MCTPAYLPLPLSRNAVRIPRPPEVHRCLAAASRGDITDVRTNVQSFVFSPSPAHLEPDPAWLYESLSVAAHKDVTELVQLLLDAGVARDGLPIESAVRGRAKAVLELFLERG